MKRHGMYSRNTLCAYIEELEHAARNPFDVFDMLPSKARPQGRARDGARTKEEREEYR